MKSGVEKPGAEAAVARTLALADVALRAVRQHRLAAFPANYAFWYAYAEGSPPNLPGAVDDILAAEGQFAQKDLERLAQAYLPDRTDGLELISDGIGIQIADVMKLLSRALHTTSAYSSSLASTLSRLGSANDARSVAMLVQMAVKETAKAEQDSRTLTERLDVSLKEIQDLKKGLEAIRAESQRDGLTGLYNRKFCGGETDRLVTQVRQSKDRLSLLILDIDHFKSFNDNHGHLTGDQVLKLVAQILAGSVGGDEFAARYGGEEFIVVLPNAGLEQACVHAEILRARVAGSKLRKKSTGESLGRITVSIGVAELLDNDTCESLIERADECLYEAKRAGRDCVIDQ